MKKIPITLAEARKEAWKMLLIKSQANMEPQTLRSTTIKEVHKIKVAVFRISEHNMNTQFWTSVLPILIPKEELA